MSGHCDFCNVWHSGSCCHPGRQWKERAERAAADEIERMREDYTRTEGNYLNERRMRKAAEAENAALRALLAEAQLMISSQRESDIEYVLSLDARIDATLREKG